VVTSDRHSGISLYAFNRDREYFDANDDGYSEIAELENTTFGTRVFHNFDHRDKLALDFFVINEKRRGGNKFDYVEHEADIAEAVEHRITTGALTYTRFFREQDLLSIYTSAQNVNRDSYYGAGQSLADYGRTEDLSFAGGVNYNADFDKLHIIGGAEITGENLEDKKLGYLDIKESLKLGKQVHTENKIVADQQSLTTGIFMQADYQLFDRLKLSAGARLDNYKITNDHENTENSGTVLSPRVNFLYDITDLFQLRGSYSAGYRAPQVFDEDLHIETSGARKIIHQNDPNLEQENSHSFMASLNCRKGFDSFSFEWLTEGFYTMIDNPFANDRSEPDADGVVTYTRGNDDAGAKVAGVNIEFRLNTKDFAINLGFTSQISEFEDDQEIVKDKIYEKKFLRTPNNYGFVAIDYDFLENWCLNVNGSYTGEMKVLHEVNEMMIDSDDFFDLGAKLSYSYKINGTTIELFGGMKNIFNSYQEDFDSGVNRDPGFIYGPMQPRTVYGGVNLKL
jgi:outer membrane receptor for ferrienterochelin and colicins